LKGITEKGGGVIIEKGRRGNIEGDIEKRDTLRGKGKSAR